MYSFVSLVDVILMLIISSQITYILQYVQGLKAESSMCYLIKRQLDHFHLHPIDVHISGTFLFFPIQYYD